MNTSVPEDQLDAIQAAIFQGSKIEAIKLYRKATGLGLKEAKDAVEEMEAELRASSPEKFGARKGGGGCMGVMGIMGIMILVGINMLL